MSPRDLKVCTGQIQELILGSLNTAIAGKLLGSVDILKDSYTGMFKYLCSFPHIWQLMKSCFNSFSFSLA